MTEEQAKQYLLDCIKEEFPMFPEDLEGAVRSALKTIGTKEEVLPEIMSSPREAVAWVIWATGLIYHNG